VTSPLLDIAGAAERLNVPQSWVRDAVTARRIQFTKVGRHVRFTEEDLAAIVAAGKQTPVVAPGRRLAVVRARTRRHAA